MSIRYAALAMAIALLAAPSAMARYVPGPPWTEAASASGITLRWYPDETPEAAARQLADAYCAQLGGRAALTELEQDGSVQFGTYRCR